MERTIRQPTQLEVLRFAQGYSRQAFAERIGISATGLANIEKGRSRPRLATASAIAQALGVEIEAVFPSEEEIES